MHKYIKRSLRASQYAKQDFGLVGWLAGVDFQYRWVVEGQGHGVCVWGGGAE